MENLERMLAEHPFFQGLEPQYLRLITGCATNVRFDPGQFLFHEGEEANAFYIIRQGAVAVEAFLAGKGSLIVDTYADGDVLGWSWLIPPYNWHLDARATELTRAIALDGKCLREKCEKDKTLGYELLKRFAKIIEQRLEASRLQLLDMYHDK
jgi:CRP/FNR family cyclic AMP-dependent transcriptional regulator